MSKTVADYLSVEIVGRAKFQDEYEQLEYSVAEKFLSDTTSRPLNSREPSAICRYIVSLVRSGI